MDHRLEDVFEWGHHPQACSTNGKVVIVRHWDGYTLLGLPDENGEQEMWSREIDTLFYWSCVINKTCVVRKRENVVTVENYWMIDEEGTEEVR